MTSWIVPCNLAYYDVAGACANLPCVTWKQTRKVCVGDIVYIYVGKPISAIKYKARAVAVDQVVRNYDDSAFAIIPAKYSDSDRFMDLELLKIYDDSDLPLAFLNEHGVKGRIMAARSVDDTFAAMVTNTVG